MSYIQVKDLSFHYPEAESQLVLKDVNFTVDKGEFVCILGQSGCGKSTLLRLLGGFEQPVSGEILIDGVSVKKPDLDRSMVFQDYGLFPWMSAGDNITLALRQRYPKRPRKVLKDIALEMLNSVGLDRSVYHKLPKELSGGMKQRCAIAQALSVDPPIFLMDEPFGALDAVTRMRLQNLLIELWNNEKIKKTVFFVTHDVDEALLLGSRILILGQSPSSVILDCRPPEGTIVTRKNQFDDPKILKLRTELIRTINEDVEHFVEEGVLQR